MHTDLEDSTGYQSTSSSRDPIWTRVSSDPAGDLIGSYRSSNVLSRDEMKTLSPYIS